MALLDLFTRRTDKETPMPQTTTETEPAATTWPEGVVGRYLNLVGATVDITDQGEETYWRYAITCAGCPRRDEARFQTSAHRSAQEHAETCRALPRPTN